MSWEPLQGDTLRILMDEHIEPAITRGLLRTNPETDILTVQQAGLRTQPDPVVLAYAAEHGRVLVSKDRSTMGQEAATRVNHGERMPGLLLIRPGVTYGEVIKALELFCICVMPDEMENQIIYIPLD